MDFTGETDRETTPWPFALVQALRRFRPQMSPMVNSATATAHIANVATGRPMGFDARHLFFV